MVLQLVCDSSTVRAGSHASSAEQQQFDVYIQTELLLLFQTFRVYTNYLFRPGADADLLLLNYINYKLFLICTRKLKTLCFGIVHESSLSVHYVFNISYTKLYLKLVYALNFKTTSQFSLVSMTSCKQTE